ncbi:MAG: hypothetical protein ABSC49_00470 [Candidatus Microgenomates bacterium]|jgi:hypothetical protein
MKLKHFGIWDVGLTKWSVLFFTLFVVSAWPAFANLVMNIHWAWFLVIALVLGVRPFIDFLKK